MAFTSFKFDVFLSYARIDDSADSWIARFEERLGHYLRQLKPGAEIFKDTRTLDVNQRFDAEIKDALRQSAVLLPIISPAFQQSTYCRQEVRCFSEAAGPGAGGTVGTDNHGRIFNVLRFNIPFDQLFEELAGVNAIEFFKEAGQYGTPINPDSEEGSALLRRLAEQIATTLDMMRTVAPAAERKRRSSATEPPSVYLPETYGSLIYDRRELCTSLRRADFAIQIRQASDSHPALIEGFRSSDLSIVLADERPGPDTMAQLELADVYATRWIVAAHPSVNLAKPARDEYCARLIALCEGHGQRNYSFLHHPDQSDAAAIGVDEIVEEAIAALKQVKCQSESRELMLDTHKVDRGLGRVIERYLASRHVGTKWSARDTQSQTYLEYEDLFNRCRAAMVVYGASEKEWIENRLDEVRKAYRDCGEYDKSVGVFYGPPLENKPRFGETIKCGRSVLLKLDDIDYSRNWKAEIDGFLERAGFVLEPAAF